MFAGNFAPRGWAFCDGQLLPVSQNTALFSILGTTYGGDGRTTVGLPNMQGNAPMHPGRGPGLTARRLGQRGGTQTVTLSEAQIPNHSHTLRVTAGPGNVPGPANTTLARAIGAKPYTASQSLVALSDKSLVAAGGSQPHNNMQPYQVINFIIALVGLYPSRS
jgi:microcystin-dependent protein